MTTEHILDAMVYIREDFLESAADSMNASPCKRIPWKRIGGLAACLLLALGIIFEIFPKKTPYDIPSHRILETADTPFSISNGKDPSIRFGCGTDGFVIVKDEINSMWRVAVEARLIDILPDLYMEPKTGERFHILRFEVCDVITGQNVPETLYFRLEEHLSTDLSNFERFIIGIQQTGLEHYSMYNENEHRFESFSLLFETSNAHGTEYGIFIPFEKDTNGFLTVSEVLWSLDGWQDAEIEYLGGFVKEFSRYPVKSGSFLQETKETLEKLYEVSVRNGYDRVYTNSDFYNRDTATAFDYMASVENGVFVQEISAWSDTIAVYYTRYINGYPTPETIEIHLTNGKAHLEWWYGESVYTQEELQQMPDISSVMKTLDLDSIIPPHTKNTDSLSVYSYFATGEYIKSQNRENLGLISVRWYLTDGKYIYYDDIYLLISADGSYRTIEREELADLTESNSYRNGWTYNTALWYFDGDDIGMLFP